MEKCVGCDRTYRLKYGASNTIALAEHRLWDLLDEKFPQHRYIVQSRPIGDWNGAVDVYFPGLRLVIQVDGITRHVKSFNITAPQQLQKDKQCNTRAEHSGLGMLRLHTADSDNEWCNRVADAIEACENDFHPFTFMSATLITLHGSTDM